MSIVHIKALTVVASIGIAGALGYEVFDFFKHGQAELKDTVTQEEMKAVLDKREDFVVEVAELVPYDRVQQVFFDMDWTGVPPPPPPPPPGPDKSEGPKKIVLTPASELLSVLLIHFSNRNPDESKFLAAYKPKLKVPGSKISGPATLYQGDKLPGEFEYVTIKEITPSHVVFSYEVPEGSEADPREDDIMGPPALPNRITILEVGADGVKSVERKPGIEKRDDYVAFNPERGHLIGDNRWQVGWKDAEDFSQNYPRILSRELQTRRWRDKSTGKYAGVQIQKIAQGSVAAQYGVKAGDILKSINGDPVTSEQEAIKYVKTNAEFTTTWVVVLESQGKERTLVYESPPEN